MCLPATVREFKPAPALPEGESALCHSSGDRRFAVDGAWETKKVSAT